MIASQPYPTYKNSGVPSIDRLPAHWNEARLKRLCSRYGLYGANVSADRYQDTGVRFLRTTDITENGELIGKGVYLPVQLVEDYLLDDGDILLSRSGTVGRSFLYRSEIHGPCAYAGYLVRFVPNSLAIPKYIYLFTKTPAFQEFLRTSAISSTIENVNAEKYANCQLPLPPLDEQAAIVRYLDYADGRIRRYVGAKGRLIALLEEERQAVVNQAVTRGLDAEVALKPSGVEWLGDVPAHWEVRRLKHWVGINEDVLPENTEPDFEFRYLEIGAVGTGMLVSEPVTTRFGSAPTRARRIVRTGDTIVSTVRTYLKATWFAEDVKDDLICSTGFAVLTPRKGVYPKFVSYIAQSNALTDRVTAASVGTAYPAIAESRLSAFHVALPPFAEQAAIVEYLDRATAGIDAAMARARRQMELVEEYRVRLIADVVTGKVDVRDGAAGLPGD